MKFVLAGALVALAGALKVEPQHDHIFEFCLKDEDCIDRGKWCSTGGLAKYCVDCCWEENTNKCIPCNRKSH